MHKAAERRDAREKLLLLEVVKAGFAGAWGGDDANRFYAATRDMLLQLAGLTTTDGEQTDG